MRLHGCGQYELGGPYVGVVKLLKFWVRSKFMWVSVVDVVNGPHGCGRCIIMVLEFTVCGGISAVHIIHKRY